MLPLKGEFCLDSDFAQLDPGTPAHQGASTLRDFIPRVANIRLQSPISLRGLRGQTGRDRAVSSKPSSRTERFCSHPSFSVPPSTGLIHPALRCMKRPITLHRMYMGSVEVTQSMRTLNFNTRMQVTRHSQHLSAVLGQINLQFSGSRVIVTVSTDSVTLISASSLQVRASSCLFYIFLCICVQDMADYIAYVAKDLVDQRACHILECPHGRASEVINSIGRAFKTRFRQLLSQTPPLPDETIKHQKAKKEGEVVERRDYYNVIPGKTPPPGGIEDLRITREENKQEADLQRVRVYCKTKNMFNQSIKSCFKVNIFPSTLSPSVRSDIEQFPPLSETRVQNPIQEEEWFHGRLGREQAESLLTCSGDFLVRESSSASGQYVLSGMEGATVRHLLLVDPHGQVRTRDQVFLSIGHLVRFHMENQMPIVSGSSELCLKQPILQSH
uniref:SHC adaptor protein 4 n=1 Tax=Amphiprion percula TaxID=161767 RepID=A0A3P8UI83_AMPPE